MLTRDSLEWRGCLEFKRARFSIDLDIFVLLNLYVFIDSMTKASSGKKPVSQRKKYFFISKNPQKPPQRNKASTYSSTIQ